jgi:hypothetical protein
MESDDLQLRDLAPAEPFLQPPGWPWWAWLLAGLVALSAVILVIAIARRKKAATPPDLRLRAESAYRKACEGIEQAGATGGVQEAATACSTAVRGYLATVCGDPSLFETHEEFLARHQALESYPAEMRERVSTGFSRLAELKYGKDRKGEIAAVTDESRRLLDQLHQQRPA